MKLITKRHLDEYKVRSLCIENQYCTCATFDCYANILSLCDGIADDTKIELMAYAIMGWSELDPKHTYKEHFANICYHLINFCCYTTVDIED